MKNNLLSIEEYRNNPEFYFSKGLRYANKKNLEDAYKNIIKALELDPDNPEYKFNMACFLSELKRPNEANRMFMDILLNFEPTMYDCFFGLGCNNFEKEDNKKAAEYFEKYLYFDEDGEFSEEVSEMILYLKLYSEISHDNRFLNISGDNLKKALKSLDNNDGEKAIYYLYKSVISNPLNLEARNLLTMELLEQQQYIRAGYINSSVLNVSGEDTWANCLRIYILYIAKKQRKADRLLEILPFRNIEDREELLCISTTLVVFNKIDTLVKLIEMYIIEYSDPLIYSVLLLGYALLNMKEKAMGAIEIIKGMNTKNADLQKWLENLNTAMRGNCSSISAVEEYQNLLMINGEPKDYIYYTDKYRNIYEKSKIKKPALKKKYLPIVEDTVKHREIMYNKQYQKEIIGILCACLSGGIKKLVAVDGNFTAYSAALELIYCKLFHITISKEELLHKYGIPLKSLTKALSWLTGAAAF